MNDKDQIEKKTEKDKDSQSQTNWPLIIGIIVGVIFVIGVIGLTFFLYSNKTTPNIQQNSNKTTPNIQQNKENVTTGPYYMTYQNPSSTYQPVQRGFEVATPELIRNISTPAVLTEEAYIDKIYNKFYKKSQI
jgi:cytoskeletal protein RodZ